MHVTVSTITCYLSDLAENIVCAEGSKGAGIEFYTITDPLPVGIQWTCTLAVRLP